MYSGNNSLLLTIRFKVFTVFIPRHLWYTCIVLCKVWILFFKAVASFWGKDGDWGHIEHQTKSSYTSWDVSILYLIIITLFADQHINLKHVERILDKTTQFHWMFCCIFFLSLPAQSFVHIGLNSSEEMSVMLSEQKAVAKYDIPWGTFTLQGVKIKINHKYSFSYYIIINNTCC